MNTVAHNGRLVVTLAAAVLATLTSAAAVTGRYVYFGNALSEPMGLVEVEVFSGGRNVIKGRPEVFTRGLDYGYWMKKRSPERKAQAARDLVDGDTDTTKRKTDFGSKVGGGYLDLALRYTSFELDLGRQMPVDSIAIYRSRYTQKQHNDLGWRILALLDEGRRIVAWRAFNVYGKEWKTNRGRWAFDMTPAAAPLAGRLIPHGKACWLSEAEFIRDCLGKPVIDLVETTTPEDEARLARFRRRNAPAEVRKLGEEFFSKVVDIDMPSMAEVKRLVERRRYAEAFEAFKKPFFANLPPLEQRNGGEGTSIYVFYSWMDEPDTRAELRARDLRSKVYGDRKDLVVKRFVPGLLPPAKPEYPFQTRPLLLDYAINKNERSLRLWEEMTDDWAMGYQAAADKNPKKLRDHFVLTVGKFWQFLKDFHKASQTNPDFVNDVSGVTIARFMMPLVEEIPVSGWRVNRKTVFNHNFNYIAGAWWTTKVLPEFKAIQRLKRETQQGFERLWTYAVYRDGPMVEIGDEGHYLAVPISPSNMYGAMKRWKKTDWFEPWLEKYFLDQFRANILSGVRNVSQTGAHVRWNANVDTMLYLDYLLDIKDTYWRNVSGGRMAWGDYYPVIAKPILSESEPRAVIDTVYGRGRERFDSHNKAREQEAVARAYGGEYQGKPSFASDWLPYAGKWYFRRGWEKTDSFLHMVKPAIVNSHSCLHGYSLANTHGAKALIGTPGSFRFCDYATPLMTSLGVHIDDMPPCPHETRYPSGSKQDAFSQAVEKPQPFRWYAGEAVDFGEAVFSGPHRLVRNEWNHKTRRMELEVSDEVVRGATVTRQIFQVRPSRVFFQVDRTKYATPGETHTNKIYDAMMLTEPGKEAGRQFSDTEQLSIASDSREIRTTCPDNAGLTVSFFGHESLAAALDVNGMRHGSTRRMMGPSITYSGYRKTTARDVLVTWKARGEDVLISALRAHEPGERPIVSKTDVSTASVAGATIETTGGVKTTLLVARKVPAALRHKSISMRGEALLVVEEPGRTPHGIALGVEGMDIDGAKQSAPSTDFQFTLGEAKTWFVSSRSRLKTEAVLRPIDPPKVLPMVNTFVDRRVVSIVSETPDVDVYYTTDGTTPTATSRRYSGPFEITGDTFIQARAYRKGVTEVPFTADGTRVSAVSYGVFEKRAPLTARKMRRADLEPGLRYEYLEGRWFALWTYTNELQALKSGDVSRLLDVSMRETDDPFAVRYLGYIDVPETGIYTFYGPREYVNNECAPGYDLRLYVDGEEWYLGQIWHGLGIWSVPLTEGLHEFKVTFADARAKDVEHQRVDLWNIGSHGYPQPRTTWRGVAPVIDVSGPNVTRRPIPTEWLYRDRKTSP